MSSTPLSTLDACLPVHLRGPGTTITRMVAGYSGAAVYRVVTADQTFVLKVSSEGEPRDAWRRRIRIQELAADDLLAPPILHVDEERRAVVSAFVVDRSFAALYGNPDTRSTSVDLAGRTLQRVHALPATHAEHRDPRALLATLASQLSSCDTVPQFARDAVEQVLSEAAPKSDRGMVLSHNDVNPTNLAYDGERLILLDWDAAGSNDPLYDLATVAMFFRMDEQTCRRLLAAHDDAPESALPAAFAYYRRLVAVLCGSMFALTAVNGSSDTTRGETLETTTALGEFYAKMRTGQVTLATAGGRRAFGLALIKEGVAAAPEQERRCSRAPAG
jgi:aminoglycoside phosphotransferase (APT) family kinase protein